MSYVDDFVNQEEPIHGLRSRCITLARAVKHAIDFPGGEGGSLIDIAEAIFDVVSLGLETPVEPLAMNRVTIQCHIPLSTALDRATGRYGDVDIPLSDGAIAKLSPEARGLLLASDQGAASMSLAGAWKLEVPVDTEEALVAALEKHAAVMAKVRREGVELLAVDPAAATDEQIGRMQALDRTCNDRRFKTWWAAALAIRSVAPILAGDPKAPAANQISLTRSFGEASPTDAPALPQSWFEKVQAWNEAVQAAAKARAEVKAKEKKLGELAVLEKRGTPSQRERYQAGMLPKRELEKLLDDERDAETDRVLPPAPGLPLFERITPGEVGCAHQVNPPTFLNGAQNHIVFRCTPETKENTDVQWRTIQRVTEAHPQAVVVLLRHEGECNHVDGCRVTVVRYGVRAEIDGLKREYAVIEDEEDEEANG
jgi:hypothetical protein